MRVTNTICEKCHSFCQAEVSGAILSYNCQCGYSSSGKIDNDPAFIDFIGYGRSEDIYNAFLLNITYKCNDTCKLCYAPVGEHRTMEWCLNQAARFPNKKVWLSGGEPTTHPDLFQMVKQMPNFAAVLSNGKLFADYHYLDEFWGRVGLDDKGFLPVVLSIHVDPPEYKLSALENMRSLGVKINCAMFSVTSVGDVPGVMQIWSEYQDVIAHARIRTPFNSWHQTGDKTLFMSELYGEVRITAPQFHITENMGGNSLYNVNLEHDGRLLSLCSAPHKSAFDIDACSCAPHMLAEDGNLYPVPLALVINEYTMC